MDADVGDGAADHQGVDAPLSEHVIERRSVEGVVADLLNDELVLARLELVDDLPAPSPPARVLGPDLPLGITLVVRVLAEDDAHVAGAGQLEQALDVWDRALRVRDEERAALADEVVLHVDHDQCGALGVELHAVVDLVLRNLNRRGHR